MFYLTSLSTAVVPVVINFNLYLVSLERCTDKRPRDFVDIALYFQFTIITFHLYDFELIKSILKCSVLKR